MKKIALLLSTILAAALPAFAADTKLEGEAVCAKCALHIADKCRAAVVVTGADGTKTTYLSEPNSEAKDLHSEICKGGKPVTVEGTVSEKDGEKLITITKYEIKK
jgi:hypothetical protein